MKRAEDVGLDLMEVSPNSKPPVCRIVNFGKLKYENKKKIQNSKKKQHVIKVKEVHYSQKFNFNFARQEKLSYREHKKDTIAIVGNGVDYTHIKLGGSGQKAQYQQAKIIKELNWETFSNKTVVGGMNFYSLEQRLQGKSNNPLESHNLNVYEGFYPSGTVQASLILEQVPNAKILAYKTIDWSWQQLYPALELVIDPNQDGLLNDSPDIMLVNYYGNNSFEYQRINKLVSNHIDKISSLNIAITASNNQTGALFSNAAPAEITTSYSNVMLQRLFISKGIKAAVVGSGNETENISLVNGYFAAYITGLIAKLKHDTCFTMVRFGNVLDSSGSVIPLFKKQIEEGGPVTVTDENIVRYFMTIPEAVELVIQASAMGQGGDVFVLDMGEPVRINDLAIKMIQLSGLQVRDKDNPDGDIEIKFIGLRPGEKLFEELLVGDNTQKTENPLIMRAEEIMIDWKLLKPILDKLRDSSISSNQEEIHALLTKIVPEFKPQDQIIGN